MPSRKGSPDKRKTALIALLQQKYPGYQPVIEIAEAAHRLTSLAKAADEAEEIEVRVQAGTLWKDAGAQHDRVAKYTTPQLKAVEITGRDGEPVRTESYVIAAEMSADEATALYKAMIGED